MTGWDAVMLTQARQVAALIGDEEDNLPDPAIGVRERYQALREAGDLAGAVEYLGHALPRPEVVAWAARLIEEEAVHQSLSARARQALDSTLRWLEAPSDLHRRAANDAAEAAPRTSPERYLGLAVFHSGGSIAPPAMDAVIAPPHACARFAVGAVEQAAYRSATPDDVFARALTLGEAIAARGSAALDAR